ncbi:hypothetical protein MMC28_006536 [Mycoblastus sanguinarius]|nr:hypothetical protein [Mycoblastus sanguinarius]
MASEFDVNGNMEQVGSHIPPYKITTVELDHLPAGSRPYFAIHNATASSMGRGEDEATGEGLIDTLKHRRLGHPTLNPQLDHLATNNIKSVNK